VALPDIPDARSSRTTLTVSSPLTLEQWRGGAQLCLQPLGLLSSWDGQKTSVDVRPEWLAEVGRGCLAFWLPDPSFFLNVERLRTCGEGGKWVQG